jgi:hypothetical protein
MTSRRKSYGRRRPKPPDGLFGAHGGWVHGCARTPEYRAYVNAKSRCRNPKNPQWRHYGGRGIEFRLPSFAVFLEHLGRRPAGKVLGRINDGDFETGNVRWTSRRKNDKNRRSCRRAPRAPEQPLVGTPNITRRAYADRATNLHRKSAHVRRRGRPHIMFPHPIKSQSIRVDISTGRTTHLVSVMFAIESRRRAAQ